MNTILIHDDHFLYIMQILKTQNNFDKKTKYCFNTLLISLEYAMNNFWYMHDESFKNTR